MSEKTEGTVPPPSYGENPSYPVLQGGYSPQGGYAPPPQQGYAPPPQQGYQPQPLYPSADIQAAPATVTVIGGQPNPPLMTPASIPILTAIEQSKTFDREHQCKHFLMALAIIGLIALYFVVQYLYTEMLSNRYY